MGVELVLWVDGVWRRWSVLKDWIPLVRRDVIEVLVVELRIFGPLALVQRLGYLGGWFLSFLCKNLLWRVFCLFPNSIRLCTLRVGRRKRVLDRSIVVELASPELLLILFQQGTVWLRWLVHFLTLWGRSLGWRYYTRQASAFSFFVMIYCRWTFWIFFHPGKSGSLDLWPPD